MSRFSPSDAALEGFRLARAHPATIITWSFIYFGGLTIIALAMTVTLGPRFIEMARRGEWVTAQQDPAQLAETLMGSAPALLVVALLTLLLISMIMAGIFRLVLRPDEPGFAHLKLGSDELKLAGANLVLVLLGLAMVAVGVFISQIAGAVAGDFGAALVSLAVLGVTVWTGVRLSLFAPMTYERRQLSFSDAWRDTQDHFWPLVGMIVLAVIFYVGISMVFLVVSLTIVELLGAQGVLKDITQLKPLAALAALVTLAMQFLLQVLQIVMVYAPFAIAYRAMSKGEDVVPRRPPEEPKEGALHSFFATYDEAFIGWSGEISRSFHWSALGYWFLAFIVLVLFQAGFAVAGLATGGSMTQIGVAGAFALGTPFNLMLLLSTVKRGRGAGVPTWVTMVTSPVLPAVALAYAFLPPRKEAAA